MLKKEYDMPEIDITRFSMTEIMSEEESCIDDGGDY